jgi:hypothetical protein
MQGLSQGYFAFWMFKFGKVSNGCEGATGGIELDVAGRSGNSIER